jgi:hypothetical protein
MVHQPKVDAIPTEVDPCHTDQGRWDTEDPAGFAISTNARSSATWFIYLLASAAWLALVHGAIRTFGSVVAISVEEPTGTTTGWVSPA